MKRFVDAVCASGVKVDAAHLFGSHAAGRATEWSDIDIALLLPDLKGDKFDRIPSRRLGPDHS